MKRIKNGALPLGVFVVNFLFCHSFNEVVLLGNPGGLKAASLLPTSSPNTPHAFFERDIREFGRCEFIRIARLNLHLHSQLPTE
nr:hypothetical protein [Methylomarinum sp. Ch1-1]MDP4519164.1 hypothetical protein [Methylomarinum sp. Ch1-1]